MSKNSKKRNRVHYSPLDSHKKTKSTLSPPMNSIGGSTVFSSWINDVLPDFLWAALIVTALQRETALNVFRQVCRNLHIEQRPQFPIDISHSNLSIISQQRFSYLFREVISNSDVKAALRPLLLIESLPDKSHWAAVLDRPVEEDLDHIGRAITLCFDHQSQRATDIRWFRSLSHLGQDRIFFTQEMSGQVEELIYYPNKGVQEQVRPSIRALELAIRQSKLNDSLPPPWNEQFWQECYSKTSCFPAQKDGNILEIFDILKQRECVAEVYGLLFDHFNETVTTTNVDARHDGAFGLTFYVLQLLNHSIRSHFNKTLPSRALLRSALETHITLAYLAEKDDQTIWNQFRHYGVGQAKLALLKNIDQETLPSFMSIEVLETLANEDMWAEYQDINLGAWANKNLRQMATDCGIKDVYDQYYDSLSGFVHGNWSAVRQVVFTHCLNPLHRFHRIPLPPRAFEEDALPDLIKFTNLCLERLNSLYPTFKPRIKYCYRKNTADDKSCSDSTEDAKPVVK